TPFTGRKSLFDDEDDTGRVIEASIDVRGRLMKVDPEQMKGGDKAGYDHMISAITWYQEVHDGKVIRQFNFKRGGWTILDGASANDANRSALAI
ncbi:MAG: phage major tail tube protein, partial [Candidatus Marinimicrobia bacterium]|nr:phage major tail tube protein [Candidatus Neomarinimicrobiota bacterium]